MIKIQRNISLAKHTTFKIGGPAKYFVVAKNTQDLIKAIKAAQQEKLPYFILGGGSNVLVSDKGFDGLVIKFWSSSKQSLELLQNNIIRAEAGLQLGSLMKFSVDQSLTGLEWAAGIPGTIGGAIRGHAGAFGHNISESVKEVRVLNKKLQIKNYKLPDCKFGYRDSIFKHNQDIILSTELKLKKGNKKKSQQLIKNYLFQRRQKQPLTYPSAGCVFKNLHLSLRGAQRATKQSRPLQLSTGLLRGACAERMRSARNDRLPAATLIEQCGLKGKKIGQAMISKEHANFIINLGGAQAKDVIKLIKIIKKEVKKKFNIKLEEEIQYL